ncbi:hypothetical protein AM82_03520, partial [Mycobacterium tuberculosis TKK_04_0085]
MGSGSRERIVEV